MLTAQRLRELLDYDTASGEFRWRDDMPGGKKAGDLAGCVSDSGRGRKYIRIRIDQRLYHAHRLAWLYVHGSWPATRLDHKDADGLANAATNLRPCPSQTENNANAVLRSDNSSGYKGVSRHGTRWCAQCRGYLGLFATPREAALTYDAAAVALFGEYARTNRSMGLL